MNDMRISIERIVWEVERGLYSMIRGPLLIVFLLQISGFIVVHAKGAGSIYADMVLILFGVSVVAWVATSAGNGNQKLLVYTLLLLTIGTMLQCILKQEQVLKHADYYATHNPSSALQLQYLIGIVVAIVAGFVYRSWKGISSMRVCRIFTVLSIGLSLLTLLVGAGSVKNWIVVGGFSFQTTELVKLLYVLISAQLLGTVEEPSRQRVITFYGITGIDVLLLAMQSEFGTMLLILMLFLTLVFLFVPDLRIFLATILCMAILIMVAGLIGHQISKWNLSGSILGSNPLSRFYLSNYNKIANRFIYWLDPNKDPLGLGYQLLKAKEAIVLGGWFGTASITDLPVKTSDLVYPALIQRCGMVFAILVFLVFIFWWLEGVRLFIRKRDRFHRVVGAGYAFMLFDQALIIIGGSTGLCPLTGITLPFISSGGTSLLVCFVMVSVLLALSGNVRWKGTNENEEDEFFEKNPAITKCYTFVRHCYDRLPHPDFRAITGSFRRGRHSKD